MINHFFLNVETALKEENKEVYHLPNNDYNPYTWTEMLLMY